MNTALLAALTLVGVASLAAKRPPHAHAGVTRVDPTHSVWDSVYTDSQAVRGDSLYKQSCSKCHGPALAGGDDGTPLAGDPFFVDWDGKALGELYDRIRNSMPPDDPKSVPRSQVADIVAYLLAQNHFPSGATTLTDDAARLRDIRIVRTR